MVNPARLTRNSPPAIAHVQAILADGNPIGLGASVHIPGGHRRITLDFAGLSLSVPERVRFRYLLEGFDHVWSEPLPELSETDTHREPGTHTLLQYPIAVGLSPQIPMAPGSVMGPCSD